VNDDVYLDAGLKGWIVNKARREFWRVASWYELDDLIQDGYICYVKCRNRYVLGPAIEGHSSLVVVGDKPTRDQCRHFMSLVQTAFQNHIMTLAASAARTTEDLVSPLPGDAGPTVLDQPVAEEATLRVFLSQLPSELREALQAVITDGADTGVYLRSRIRQDGGRVRLMRRAVRETTSQYWARCLGQPQVPERLAALLRS